MPRGGKRENSGRHKTDNPVKNHTITLTDEHWGIFIKKGGVKWLRSLLTCFVLCFVFSMPAYSAFGWTHEEIVKNNNAVKPYDVSREANYRKKLEADFIKK